jgi:transcription elongation factor GreB
MLSLAMSKAFTREDDDAGFAPPPSSAPPAARPLPGRLAPLTAEGATRLHAELERLSAALADGDREAAGRASAVRAILESSEVIAAPSAPGAVVFGATVTFRHEDGRLRTIRIVGPHETDEADRATAATPASVTSPLAQALLGARVGDAVEITTPRGLEEIEVVALR